MSEPRKPDQRIPDAVRILLIEDEQISAEIAAAFLNRIKWTVTQLEIAATLREALTLLARESFDLVISDLNLPDSKGLATLEAVVRACDRVIIVLTANDDPGLREMAIELGAYDLLQKGQLSEATLERLVRLATVQAATVRSLRESETRFRQTFELAGSGIAHVGHDGRLLQVNHRLCDLLGYAEAEIVGRSMNDIEHPEDRDLSEPQRAGLNAGELDAMRFEKRYLRKDGSVAWMDVTVALARDADGKPQYEIAVMDDVTERKRAEERQRAHMRYQETIARFGQSALGKREPAELIDEAVQTVMQGLRADGVAYVEAGPAAGEVVLRAATGRAALVADASLIASRPGDAIATVLHSGSQFVGTGAALPFPWARPLASAAVVPVRGERGVRGALCALARARDAFAPEALGFLDTAASLLSTGLQRIDSEGRLTFLAQFDPLTGLPNRALLTDRFTQMIVQAKRRDSPLGVLFIDLDDFKLVNDTLGHAGGDELLRETARRLQAAVRTGDTVARISGDEFAVILSDLVRPEDAALVAQNVLDGLARPFVLGGHETFVTASVGIAAFPGDGEDAETLLGAADAAMYRAKQTGRNAYHYFTSEITQRTRVRAQLALELRRALERGEFALAYQLKIDLASGKPCGAEALLRWNHPDRGVVAPLEFVPMLEETGLIVPVGEWVVRRACEDLKVWQAAGIVVLPVAVNLSARQFRQQHLDTRIRSLVRSAGVDPGLIELEITESQLMQDPDHAIRVMRSLRESGIEIAIDDFGTGYSSLAYLTRFPVAALKIDRSFVADVFSDTNDAAIVRTIIDMAHTLGFTVIAEGVETDQQMAFLRQFGCQQGQGYLFARPMPAADLSALISS
jgi:diguanylate cyclase (GGDEF)-like protein/PAS domain S-box-containing protein